MPESDLRLILPEPEAAIAAQWPGGTLYFESPRNPHSGCFVLSRAQLFHWVQQRIGRMAIALGCPLWRVLLPLGLPKLSDCLSR